jgi:hypothetical protein
MPECLHSEAGPDLNLHAASSHAREAALGQFWDSAAVTLRDIK